jgi:hypothetical protein
METADFRLVYIDPYSLLVASGGRITRIHCPFTVRAIREVGDFEQGRLVSEEMVKSDKDGWLVYIIQGKGYWYGNFQIYF